MLVWIIILSILLFIALVVIVFTTIGMFKGLKKVEYYESTLINISNRISNTYTKMVEIDTLGAFEADDDVGIVFDELKTLVGELKNYINEDTNLENIHG